MRDKGSELEDTVAKYFREIGFDTETRVKMKDRFDVFHEIDVVASKQEEFGKIDIAVECKFVSGPMDIKEIRNFHDKLSALGFTKGIFVSTGGFTSDAQSHAAALGMELWDERILEQKIAKLRVPETGTIHDVLPIKVEKSAARPNHLKNYQALKEMVHLALRPFYLMEYGCFSQHSVLGNAVVIESKGVLLLDADNGHVVASRAREGTQPAWSNAAYAELLNLRPVDTVQPPDNIRCSVIAPKLDSSLAKESAKTELVKRLSVNYQYHTHSAPYRRVKVIQPKKREIEILDFRHIKIPTYIALYQVKNFNYLRTLLASTGAFTHDDLAKCAMCMNPPSWICSECGTAVCEAEHSRNCSECGKIMCPNCGISKGIISKKHYCKDHAPK
jgi:predicted RecB family endonuclease